MGRDAYVYIYKFQTSNPSFKLLPILLEKKSRKRIKIT